MGSLVFELRADACDESVNVLNLLRKAQVVSTLLKVRSISEWLRQEMEGYDLNEEIPEYRKVTGRIMYRHPRNGYMPVDMGHAELEKMISSMTLRNPLSEFYETIALSDKKRSVGISYGSEQCAEMRSLFNTPTSEFLLEIPITLIDRIVSSVRNKILTVALELEGQGIMGEGMTFTKEEKLTASQNNYSITIGTMNGSQIQQATTGSTQSYTQSADIDGISAFVEKLLPSIDLLHNNHTDREQIRSDLETIRSLIKAPSPRFSMIRECLHSVKAILEGASGNLLAAQCLQLLPPLIASIPV